MAKVSEGSFAATQGTKCTKKGKGLAVGIGGIGMFSYELLDVPRHKIQTGHLLVALNGVETPDLTPDTFKPDSHGVMKQQMQQAHCLSTDLHLHVLGCESRTEAELESQTGQFPLPAVARELDRSTWYIATHRGTLRFSVEVSVLRFRRQRPATDVAC